MNFTYEEYRGLLLFLKEVLGYEVCRFDSIPNDRDYVIMRHDIDFSLASALRMAEVDHSCGVRSTFFVLMGCDYYDATSPESLDRILAIQELGHEIGLHFDVSQCNTVDDAAINEEVRRLAEKLGELVGSPIRSISQHKPRFATTPLTCDAYINAYGPEYFREIGYASDSRMHFAEKDLESFFRANKKSQILIHPVWWSDERRTRSMVFRDLSREQGGRFDSLLESEAAEIEKFFSPE
jgi:hypothetical protein